MSVLLTRTLGPPPPHTPLHVLTCSHVALNASSWVLIAHHRLLGCHAVGAAGTLRRLRREVKAARAVVAAERQQLLFLRAARDQSRARDVRQPQLAGSCLDVFGVGHLSRVAVGVTVVLVNVLSPPALPELRDLRLNLKDEKANGNAFENNSEKNNAIC